MGRKYRDPAHVQTRIERELKELAEDKIRKGGTTPTRFIAQIYKMVADGKISVRPAYEAEPVFSSGRGVVAS